MYLGFDIGGSSIKAALVQKNRIVGTRFERLPRKFDELVNIITDIKNDFTGNKALKINGVGFSVAGALDKKREKVLASYNIPYLSNKNLLKIFQRRLSPLPVRIERDAFCFLIAEAKVGMGKKYKDIYYLTLGTGIGGAYMQDRKLITGYHGAAGEVGHVLVDFKNKTHWEDLAANRFIKSELNTRFSEAKQRASTDNPKARKVFDQLGDNIGFGIANIINSFDPEVIIISGGLAAAKNLILPGVRNSVKKYVISPEARHTKILWSKLGRFGGALGAALLFEK